MRRRAQVNAMEPYNAEWERESEDGRRNPLIAIAPLLEHLQNRIGPAVVYFFNFQLYRVILGNKQNRNIRSFGKLGAEYEKQSQEDFGGCFPKNVPVCRAEAQIGFYDAKLLKNRAFF
jgi:hypothetical protein